MPPTLLAERFALASLILALLVSGPVLAQPTSSLYAAARDAGASPADAGGLSAAMRFVAPVQEARLLASDGAQSDQFGISVSLDGDRALVGAYFHDGVGTGSGVAYVFVRSGTDWTQEAELMATDATPFDNFGIAVSLSGDRALVGSPFDDDTAGNSGSAYVFARSGSTWAQETKLTASDAGMGDEFGTAVSLDGDRAIVGAYVDDDAGDASGSAYVYVRSGTTWTQEAKLVAQDASAADNFGVSVSLSGDRALVGANRADIGTIAPGTAYVFVRAGSTWTQEAKLIAEDRAASDNFGIAVSLSGDRALVGSNNDDTPAGNNSGSAYVFVRSGSMWTQEAKLTAADAAANDRFGASVALSGDRALVGAGQDDDTAIDSGSAYVFVRSESAWTQDAKLAADDAAAVDVFGNAVALSGERALVAAYLADGGAINSGAAYVFSGIVTVAAEPGAEARGVTLSATPNPVSGIATVTLTLDAPQTLSVSVVDVLGREVARLHDGPLAAGPHALRLDTARLPAGVYVVRVTAGTSTLTQRLTVVR